TVAFAKRVAAQKNRERSAALELIHARDDRIERLLVAPIAINGVEAGRPAGCFVGLWKRLNRQAQGVCQILTGPGNIVVHGLNAVEAASHDAVQRSCQSCIDPMVAWKARAGREPRCDIVEISAP